MSNLIQQLYNKIVNREYVFTRRSLANAYNLVLEDTAQFTQGNIRSEWVPWTPFQREWYDKLKAQQALGDETIGPGEISVAIVLLQAARPDLTDEVILQKFNLIRSMVLHNGPSTVDVYDLISKKYYEVKQASEKKSVMVGKESRGPALQLYNKIKSDFESLYASYSKLSPEHKALIERFKDSSVKTMTFEKIMTTGHQYFKDKPGELARGCIIQPKQQSSTPKLFLIPRFLTDEFFYNPEIKDVIPDAVEYIKDLYNVNTLDARIIDKGARDFIESKRKTYLTGDTTPVDPATALSDFVLFGQISIFASKEIFFDNVVSYFTPGTEASNKVLAQIFPNEGMFAVDPNLGYLYAGRQHLGSLLRVENITKGIFKVVPVDTPEGAETL